MCHLGFLQLQGTGFSCCRAWALGHVDSIVAANGLSCPSACGILVSQQVIKPASPALDGRFLTTGQPGKSHWSLGFKNLLGYDDSEIYNCRSDLSSGSDLDIHQLNVFTKRQLRLNTQRQQLQLTLEQCRDQGLPLSMQPKVPIRLYSPPSLSMVPHLWIQPTTDHVVL